MERKRIITIAAVVTALLLLLAGSLTGYFIWRRSVQAKEAAAATPTSATTPADKVITPHQPVINAGSAGGRATFGPSGSTGSAGSTTAGSTGITSAGSGGSVGAVDDGAGKDKEPEDQGEEEEDEQADGADEGEDAAGGDAEGKEKPKIKVNEEVKQINIRKNELLAQAIKLAREIMDIKILLQNTVYTTDAELKEKERLEAEADEKGKKHTELLKEIKKLNDRKELMGTLAREASAVVKENKKKKETPKE